MVRWRERPAGQLAQAAGAVERSLAWAVPCGVAATARRRRQDVLVGLSHCKWPLLQRAAPPPSFPLPAHTARAGSGANAAASSRSRRQRPHLCRRRLLPRPHLQHLVKVRLGFSQAARLAQELPPVDEGLRGGRRSGVGRRLASMPGRRLRAAPVHGCRPRAGRPGPTPHLHVLGVRVQRAVQVAQRLAVLAQVDVGGGALGVDGRRLGVEVDGGGVEPARGRRWRLSAPPVAHAASVWGGARCGGRRW
jgi:hypothetical protein